MLTASATPPTTKPTSKGLAFLAAAVVVLPLVTLFAKKR